MKDKKERRIELHKRHERYIASILAKGNIPLSYKEWNAERQRLLASLPPSIQKVASDWKFSDLRITSKRMGIREEREPA